ncbi:hypothetical protein Bca101_077478 [Brassica carinata]
MLYMFTLPQEIRFEALDFYKKKHPEAAWDILKYGLCGVQRKSGWKFQTKNKKVITTEEGEEQENIGTFL